MYCKITTNQQTVFVLRPAKRTSVAQGLFKVGLGARPLLRRVQRFQKCLGTRRHSPKKVSLGDGPLRHEVVLRRDTPDQIRAVDTTAGLSVSNQLDSVD